MFLPTFNGKSSTVFLVARKMFAFLTDDITMERLRKLTLEDIDCIERKEDEPRPLGDIAGPFAATRLHLLLFATIHTLKECQDFRFPMTPHVRLLVGPLVCRLFYWSVSLRSSVFSFFL